MSKRVAKASNPKANCKADGAASVSAPLGSGKKLVIVESPTKARTIRKFLGKDFVVESCMGHVRDLPQSAKDIPEKYKKQPWATLGVNVDNQFDPIYCVPKNKTKIVTSLKARMQEADELILATDEDREGESISWHLVELLRPRVPYRRMVFHEITKEAIQQALQNFRSIDENLVRAQEARRILDRLVGYTLSPLLWKKIAYGLSAGRVQSVAVHLLTEREHQRLRFKVSQYAGMVAKHKKAGIEFESRLISYKQKKIATGKDFDGETGGLIPDVRAEILHLDLAGARQVESALAEKKWTVLEAEEKPVSRKPAAPFITSTLQQEANRKLGMGSRETMQVAQSLYESGYITYMRTDSTFLSQQAIQAARSSIQRKYGNEYLPDEPRSYAAKKVKGAQEAHEAIRPAGTEFVEPEKSGLSGKQLALYEMVWKRTVASQMVNARQKQVSVRLGVGEAVFAASGLTIEFAGFLRAYVEGHDDPEAALEEREVPLPPLAAGESISCLATLVQEHETKPPARYTEASLVQTMEREGIGRPSTYAAIISTIIDRGYCRKQSNSLVPTFTAMVVANLLKKHLSSFVDPTFTAKMEKALDDIADGELDWVNYLKSIYFGASGLKNTVESRDQQINPDEARGIELEGMKGLSFRVGRYGAYVCRKEAGEEVCASLPESQAPADVTSEIANKLIDQKVNGSDALGKDSKTGLPVYVLTGRYGPYVQLGDSAGDSQKPKRASLPPGVEPEKVDLPMALQLLSLPRVLGKHPQTDKEIKAGLGRFGPYVVHEGDFRSIPKTDSLFEINLERALELLSRPKRGRGQANALRELGADPQTGEVVVIMDGKFGPYVKSAKLNVSLPEGAKVDAVDLAQALVWLNEKRVQKNGGSRLGKTKVAKSELINAAALPPVKSARQIGAKTKNASPASRPAKSAKPRRSTRSLPRLSAK